MLRPIMAALGGLLLVSIGFSTGLVVYHYELPPYATLRDGYHALSNFVDPPPEPPHAGFSKSPVTGQQLSAAQRKEIRRLKTLGYLSTVEPTGTASGVTVHKDSLAYPGVNLFSIGHRPEARLMSMSGQTLHTWTRPFLDSFPNDEEALEQVPGASNWRRVHLFPNGDLLAIHEGVGLVKLNRHSEILWARRNNAHHDLEVTEDGRIFLLTREPELVPWFDEEDPVTHDFVEILDADGSRIRRISLLEALRDSPYRSLLNQTPRKYDPLHTNDLELLDGRLGDRLPAFKKGNLLVSFCWFGSVVLDLETEAVVWALVGLTGAHHHPTLLDSGNLLFFDNSGDKGGLSRVIEMNLINQQIEWFYDNSMGFLHSKTCGSNHRLPNGNTLITETDRGRAIEVTAEGEIVWEYIAPERGGENNEFIALLFEVIRLDREPTWLAQLSERNGQRSAGE